MSTARKTPSAPTTPDETVELPVGAEPDPLLGVTPATNVAQIPALMQMASTVSRTLQEKSLVIFEAHDDETVRELAGMVHGLATITEALAKVNA